MAELEENDERREQASRKNNVLLFNVPETEPESLEDCERLFLGTVNEVLPSKLKEGDVCQVRRLGRADPDKTRPLIATLNRTADKVAVLQARQKLQERKIGVSGDKTPFQRRRLQEERAAGNYAFFKGGRLHVTPGERVPRDRRPRDRLPRDRVLTRSATGARSMARDT